MDIRTHHLERTDRPGRAAVTVVSATGELDACTAVRLDAAITSALAPGGGGDLVLDLSEVCFVDSYGLRVIVRAHQRALSAGCRCLLVSGSPLIAHVFALTGLQLEVPLHSCLGDALGPAREGVVIR